MARSESLEQVRILGRGISGTTALFVDDGDYFVMKTITLDLPHILDKIFTNTKRYLDVQIDHFQKILDVNKYNDRIVIEYEYIEPQDRMKERDIKKDLYNVACGLAKLHKLGLLHLNIDHENLVNGALVCIGTWVQQLMTKYHQHYLICNNAMYLPELQETIRLNKFNEKVDIFLFGRLLKYHIQAKNVDHRLSPLSLQCMSMAQSNRPDMNFVVDVFEKL